MPRMSASGKRIGRPPKKGTHVATNSMSAVIGAAAADALSPPPPSGTGEAGEETAKRKRKSPHKK